MRPRREARVKKSRLAFEVSTLTPVRRTKSRIRWWRGYELYILVAVFWYAVIGIWLALLTGSESNGSRIPMNPIAAVYHLLAGHITWPGSWATSLVVIEVLLLVAVGWLIRRMLIERTQRSTKN